MFKINFKYFLIITYCLVLTKSFASDSILITNKNKVVDISSLVLVYEDKTNQLPFEDAVHQKFISTNKIIPNLGISKSTFWIKLPMVNKSANDLFLLNLSMPTIDFVEFYYPDDNKIYKSIDMGEHLPFSSRKYEDPDYIFDVSISTGQSKVYYLKIQSKEGVQLPMKIGLKEDILNQVKNKGILSGIYFGIMLVMVLYNLFIYFSVNDKSYLYYVVYIIFTFFTQISLQGYSFQYFWPNSPIISQYSLFVFPALVGISGIMFMNVFLDVKYHSILLYKISFILYVPYVVSIVFLIIQNFKVSQMTMEINAILVSVYMLFTSIIILKKGYKPAKFFLIGWSIFLIGICIYVLKDFGFLPYNIFTRYTMHFGTAAEVILLSFALADRINILKQEKEQSQTEALLALQKNEKLIIEQNVVLENRVQERTIELKHTNEELNSTLSNLKDAQTQLVNVEKMASLGQLTAGIAHEINNPINFVSANIKPLKLDFIDILGLIKEYETITPETDLTIKLKDIENYKEQIDLTYLITEIESLISVIDDGAQRTIEIVAGLKNFSRLDESDIKIANINEGIRSTLILLKSAIPKNTTVITDLGNIPSIDCLPGKLNQVFMNLLSNAIYAITKKKTDDENKIIIKTYELNDHIYVSIEDTGIGMTDTVKAKVFDPFFTTKDVGEGTGLGMSIVYKIIESHQAKIEIESEFGVGTKMTLILNKRLNNY
jgi:two-component system NtrC family sensor kinase